MGLTHCNILKSWTYIRGEAEKHDSVFFPNSANKGEKCKCTFMLFSKGACSGESTPMLHPNVYIIDKRTDHV